MIQLSMSKQSLKTTLWFLFSALQLLAGGHTELVPSAGTLSGGEQGLQQWVAYFHRAYEEDVLFRVVTDRDVPEVLLLTKAGELILLKPDPMHPGWVENLQEFREGLVPGKFPVKEVAVEIQPHMQELLQNLFKDALLHVTYRQSDHFKYSPAGTMYVSGKVNDHAHASGVLGDPDSGSPAAAFRKLLESLGDYTRQSVNEGHILADIASYQKATAGRRAGKTILLDLEELIPEQPRYVIKDQVLMTAMIFNDVYLKHTENRTHSLAHQLEYLELLLREQVGEELSDVKISSHPELHERMVTMPEVATTLKNFCDHLAQQSHARLEYSDGEIRFMPRKPKAKKEDHSDEFMHLMGSAEEQATEEKGGE